MSRYNLVTQQPLGLMYNMFHEALVSPPAPLLFSDVSANLIACISIVTLLFLLFNHILGALLAWILEVIPENDLEGGDIIYRPPIDFSGSSPIRIAMVQNMMRLGVIKRVISEFDEERGPRLRALKKLPPLVNYGSHESTSHETACAICLEDFEQGDSCQKFSVCKHMYHSNCIDNWLMNKPSCPVCRNYIIDG